MDSIASNKWIQLGVVVIVAVVVGVLVGPSLLGSDGGNESAADAEGSGVIERVLFSTGSTLDPQNIIELPVVPDNAVTAGWKDPVLCSVGRGRYFMRAAEEEREQYVLMYNRMKDKPRLIGIYNYSFTEMPPPWKKIKYLNGAGGVEIVSEPHWGIFTYFWDPTRACKTTEAAEGTRPYLIH